MSRCAGAPAVMSDCAGSSLCAAAHTPDNSGYFAKVDSRDKA
jgi:hypothetical protein